MRLLLLFCAATISLFILYSCSGGKKSQPGKSGVAGETSDPAVYYDAEIGTIQRSYKKELQGKWNIVVMHRQQKAIPEKLSDASITFADTSILGKAPCNTFYGEYTLKGTSVKFSELLSTKMACPALEQETAFMKLLEQTVSAYSVTDKKLYLRDGASNIVFECEKAE